MNNQQLPHPGGYDRDRELEDRQRALREHEEILRRERDRDDRERDREREHAERSSRDPYPQNVGHTGSIELHQPVASRLPGAIHNPNGLLANHGGPTSSGPIGPPSTNGAGPFGTNNHDRAERSAPSGSQNGPAPAQHQIFTQMSHGSGPVNGVMSSAPAPGTLFGPPLPQESQRNGGGASAAFPGSMSTSYAMAPSSGGLAQGQQPILNDALSYLDQVKVQFSEQPDVYNRFLDIMKDFKSQTIDTPGVISRVSELFAGHPNLIQGFNTFLPPGYRIECGLENNPNSIRVTTPSGSTIHSIGTGRPLQLDSIGSHPTGAGQRFTEHRPAGWQPPIHHSIESPEARFSTPAQGGQGNYGPGHGHSGPFGSHSPNQQARNMHQNQVSGLGGQVPIVRNALTPTPSAAQVINGAAQQANMEKRGPVEFNHAISYVNKIKNRFQDKPEIYKNFLEILQTYQREQKPIQEVYAQVTTLFNSAPDLLEDFKQFLPETTAHARAGQRQMDELFGLNRTPQPGQGARDGPKMPPVGNFAPPGSAVKDKKRVRDKNGGLLALNHDVPGPNARGSAPTGNNKRIKTSHMRNEGAFIEPTLTPMMPEPLAPTPASVASLDDMAFFEKVKKYLNNKTVLAEFLKLMNLYTNDLIDKDTLIHKASHFIGGHPELFNYLKSFLNYAGDEMRVDNQPAPPTGRVSLSNCRAFGPSYRLLPRREKLKPCSGRDELCNSVLNDEWASHPTWASEDSGFVAHRKNGYEEGLHRIEEERHDYDFYIELNQKCIQLLEPIAHQMLTLSPHEREQFRMPLNLGGQSSSIYKRTFKKIYGMEYGAQVVADMFTHPFSVVPVLSARLRQKDEEWRFTQREWERVWQAQTANMFLRSLDHMGIQVKSNDKKHYSTKHIVDVIKTKYEEQRRDSLLKHKRLKYQFIYNFNDKDLILDILRLMMLWTAHNGQFSTNEKDRINDFVETFIPRFFGIPEDKVQQRVGDIERESGEEDGEDTMTVELTNGRTSRRNGKNGNLLRGVLDPSRNGSKVRVTAEENGIQGSKESTPEGGSANEDEQQQQQESNTEDVSIKEVINSLWLATSPVPTVAINGDMSREEARTWSAHGTFPRKSYNLYCNQTIYVFFSVFQALYTRMKDVKNSTASVKVEVAREHLDKPAKHIGMMQDELGYFDDIVDDSQIWPHTMGLLEEFVINEVDEARFQDVMRHYYLTNGWTLYTIHELIKTLIRTALICNGNDNKDKTPELVNHFLTTRHQNETEYQEEIASRKFAEKSIKDGDLFVLSWFPTTNDVTARWLHKDDSTVYMDEMDPRDKWQYYVSSWTRTEPTEGVDRALLRPTVLLHNLQVVSADDSSTITVPSHDLGLRICVNSSKLGYIPGTSSLTTFGLRSYYDSEVVAKRKRVARALGRWRENKFAEKLVMNNKWMKGLGQDEVQGAKEVFGSWKVDGVLPVLESHGRADAGDAGDEEVEGDVPSAIAAIGGGGLGSGDPDETMASVE